jgi:hypothetical protein
MRRGLGGTVVVLGGRQIVEVFTDSMPPAGLALLPNAMGLLEPISALTAGAGLALAECPRFPAQKVVLMHSASGN